MNYNTYFHLKKKTFVSPLYSTVNTSFLTRHVDFFPTMTNSNQLRVLQFNSNTVYLELRTHSLKAQSYKASPTSDANIKCQPPLLWLYIRGAHGPLLQSDNQLENLTELRETHLPDYYTIKNMIKDIDEEPGKEAERAKSGEQKEQELLSPWS